MLICLFTVKHWRLIDLRVDNQLHLSLILFLLSHLHQIHPLGHPNGFSPLRCTVYPGLCSCHLDCGPYIQASEVLSVFNLSPPRQETHLPTLKSICHVWPILEAHRRLIDNQMPLICWSALWCIPLMPFDAASAKIPVFFPPRCSRYKSKPVSLSQIIVFPAWIPPEISPHEVRFSKSGEIAFCRSCRRRK